MFFLEPFRTLPLLHLDSRNAADHVPCPMAFCSYSVKKLATPYFRDWSRLQYSKGKTFIAPPKVFKADRALYFPNFHGRTLASRRASDTTTLCANKISLVSIFSGTWAERQTASYVGAAQHPELDRLLQGNEAAVGKIDINVEEGWLKSLLLRLFIPFLRRNVPRQRHHRYFLIRKGVTDDVLDMMGFVNRRVGYVYLVDGQCKIRWAASGVATPDEKDSLIRAVAKLLENRQEKGEPASDAAHSSS